MRVGPETPAPQHNCHGVSVYEGNVGRTTASLTPPDCRVKRRDTDNETDKAASRY